LTQGINRFHWRSFVFGDAFSQEVSEVNYSSKSNGNIPKLVASVVMPVYREGKHLIGVLEEIRERLTRTGMQFEIVLVDDGSPDDSWVVISEQAERFPMLRAARLSRNFGKEAALSAGLEMARGDIVIVMDADGQHPPSLLSAMIERWHAGDVDIVEAVKASRGKETLFSKFTAWMFYLLWNKLSGFELRGASDYKLLNRRAVNAYLQMQERNVFFRGMTAWLGFRRAQIPFEVAERSGGRSGWSVLRLVHLAITGITAFSALPLQLVTFVGFMFLIFSVIFGIYTLGLQLYGLSVSGFATVILLILFTGSLLMISLGIIGVYIERIYEEIKFRPRYVVSQSTEPSFVGSSEPERAFTMAAGDVR
jgi:polyisoprenyl-phosphate glycosyltransferase